VRRYSDIITMNDQCRMLALIMACFMPAIGYGSNWVPIPVSSLEGSALYVDTESVVKKGNFVRIWERLVLNRPSKYPAIGTFQSCKFYMSYNCGQKSAALLETRFYKDFDSLEEVANSIHARPRYMFVAPGTPSETKLDEVCKLAKGHRNR